MKEQVSLVQNGGDTDRRSGCAHKLVQETSVQMAHTLYDTLMQDNVWYAGWKAKFPGLSGNALARKFVQKIANTLLPQARAMLAHMLTTTNDMSLRETIYDALLLDASLMRGIKK